MSYILDALKKAERERNIAQVPTLSTVHDSRTKPPIRLWTASGIVVLCIAVFVLLFFLGSGAENEVEPSLAEGTGSPVNLPEPEPLKAPVPADESPVPIRSSESRTTPGLEASRDMPVLADEAGIDRTDSERREPIVDEDQANQSIRAATASRAATESRAAADPVSGSDTPGDPPQDLSEHPIPESKMQADSFEEPEASTDAAEQAQASLREAIDSMDMSILFYSENAEERLVFINGRKYVEGDTVEGYYLLESITPEGAVFSYRDERALLRPDRN